MFLPPVAHITLHRHWVIARNLVALQFVGIASYPLELGLGVLDQEGNDLCLIFAFAHLRKNEFTPVMQLFAQASSVLPDVFYCTIVPNVQDVRPQAANKPDAI